LLLHRRATHDGNFYQAAPLAQVREYIEDLALWGANTVALIMPWEEYQSFEDPLMVEQIAMLVALFKVRLCACIHSNTT
jgi:hypothetical protein